MFLRQGTLDIRKPIGKCLTDGHMLVIDGKYNSDYGLCTTVMINRKIEDKSRKIE
jgi:hypothetical protein